jgi:hypothetical protein
MTQTMQPMDAYAAYQAHLATARALAADDVLPYRLDPDIAIINIETGMRMIAEHEADIRVHLPRIDLAGLGKLPELALAVKFAAMEADRATSDRTMSEMMAESRHIRATLMRILNGLVAAGLIPEEIYRAILQGTGPRDTAEDCVALNKVFRDHAPAIQGKHPADPAMIERAAVVGTWLLQNLRKANAPIDKPDKPAEVDIRNRLATLLVQGHERLQAVAFYFHGSSYEQIVPALMSRRLVRRPETTPGQDVPQDPAASADE